MDLSLGMNTFPKKVGKIVNHQTYAIYDGVNKYV